MLFFLSAFGGDASVSTSPSSFMTTTEFLLIFAKICGILLLALNPCKCDVGVGVSGSSVESVLSIIGMSSEII